MVIEGVLMENKEIKTVRCNNCNAEFSEDIKFCTECGKPVEIKVESNEELSYQVVCQKCNAEIPSGVKFCEECGAKVENIGTLNQKTTCPKCYADVAAGIGFCEECGTKINHNITKQETTCPKCYADVLPGSSFCEECGSKIVSTVKITTCPKCYAEVTAGETFCTECGTSMAMKGSASSANINQELKRQRELAGNKNPPLDETLDSVVKSGKGLMKGLGGFLDKAASELDKNLNQSNKSQSVPGKNVGEMIRKSEKKEVIMPGFLVCDACGGYYELQAQESPDDFSDECACGGHLEHHSDLP